MRKFANIKFRKITAAHFHVRSRSFLLVLTLEATVSCCLCTAWRIPERYIYVFLDARHDARPICNECVLMTLRHRPDDAALSLLRVLRTLGCLANALHLIEI